MLVVRFVYAADPLCIAGDGRLTNGPEKCSPKSSGGMLGTWETWETTDLCVREEATLIWLIDRFNGLVMKFENTGDVPNVKIRNNRKRVKNIARKTMHVRGASEDSGAPLTLTMAICLSFSLSTALFGRARSLASGDSWSCSTMGDN